MQRQKLLIHIGRFKYEIATTIFVLALLCIKLVLISLQLVDTERGDASVYFFEGALNNTPHFQSILPWLNIHPPLPEILSSLLFKVYQDTLLDSAVSYVQLVLMVLSILYAMASGVFYVTVKNLFSPIAAATGTLFFASAGLLQIVTLNGNAEAFALLFFVISIYCFSHHAEQRGRFDLFLSALFLLLASLCRTEALILVPIICLALVVKKQLINSIFFGLLTSSFEVTKVLAKKLLFNGKVVGYENMEQKWHVTEKTFKYVVFESPTASYIYSSYSIFFFILIFSVILLIGVSRKSSFFLVLFVAFFFFISFFQITGRIPDLERYGFFQVICFAFVIASVYSKIYEIKFIKAKFTGVLFLVSLIVASTNFYLAILDRISRSPQEVRQTKDWLLDHASVDDPILFEFMYYWSWNPKQHLASELKARHPDYEPEIFTYSYGIDKSWTEQDFDLALDWRNLGDKTKNYFIDTLRTAIVPSNSVAYKVKQKLLAEIFIATKKPKYLVVPKHDYDLAPHVSKSFVRSKIVPLTNRTNLINLEYLDMSVELERVYENEGFDVFLAGYSKLNNRSVVFEGVPPRNSFSIQIVGQNAIFGEVNLKADQCVKPLVVNVRRPDGLLSKFAFYHLNEGINTLVLTPDYLSSGPVNDINGGARDIKFDLKFVDDVIINDCVEWLKVITLDQRASNASNKDTNSLE